LATKDAFVQAYFGPVLSRFVFVENGVIQLNREALFQDKAAHAAFETAKAMLRECRNLGEGTRVHQLLQQEDADSTIAILLLINELVGEHQVLFKDGILLAHADVEYEAQGVNPLTFWWKDKHSSLYART